MVVAFIRYAQVINLTKEGKKKVSKQTNLSERCRQLRARLRMNQAQLAQKLGISRNYVSMIEMGRKPSLSVEMLIAQLEAASGLVTAAAATLQDSVEGVPPVRMSKEEENWWHVHDEFMKRVRSLTCDWGMITEADQRYRIAQLRTIIELFADDAAAVRTKNAETSRAHTYHQRPKK